MTSPHRKPLARGWALTIAWGGMVLTLLLVVAFVAWVNQRVAPQAMAPRAVQAAPAVEPTLPETLSALFDAARMECLVLKPPLREQCRAELVTP
jgi:hypothetical protein